MKHASPKAFTLIELLIVVAIIAILAAIAVPNFLEAQTRSKVSRVRADLRTYATAMESYVVDYNNYPISSTFGIPGRAQENPNGYPILEVLSTPIAYLSNGILPSPFGSGKRISSATAQGLWTANILDNNVNDPVYRSYIYQSGNSAGRVAWPGNAQVQVNLTPSASEAGGAKTWFLKSPGPTEIYYNLAGILINQANPGNALEHTLGMMYDPTNGTISDGAIWRAGGDMSNFGRTTFQAITTTQ